MKVDAAGLRNTGEDRSVEEIDLAGPKEGEVLVRYTADGLCHSDDHIRVGTSLTSAPTASPRRTPS